MDICSFINASKDVVDHCRKVSNTLDIFGMALIIATGGGQYFYKPEKISERQRAAFQELINNYPDMPAPRTFEQSGSTRFYESYPLLPGLNPNGPETTHELLARIIKNGDAEPLKSFIFQLPLPFDDGDILMRAWGSWYGDDDETTPVVYVGNEIFIGKDGLLCCDHTHEIEYYEYFRGELDENNRLLYSVSKFIRGEIEAAEFLEAQYNHIGDGITPEQKNRIEDDLLDFQKHGYFIPHKWT
jgi:hypothetical protein